MLPQIAHRFSEAFEVAARSQHEIDLYRGYSNAFGYVFFVMQRVERLKEKTVMAPSSTSG